jgi:adenylate cyclase
LYEAELHRLRGEQLLGGPGEPAPAALARAEEAFGRALDVARRQGAWSLALRAAMSLVRLGQRLGRAAEALPLLAGTYACFTEGFETPDLREARALLDGPA